MKKRYIWAVIIILTVGPGLFLYAHKSGVYNELNSLKLIPQPEVFTELYMNDFTDFDNTLPQTITPGDTINFSFTIHNEEGKTTAYPYVVYIVGDHIATTTIDMNTVKLADTAATSISESYTFKSSVKQADVYVVLTGLNQSLHFFVPAKT